MGQLYGQLDGRRLLVGNLANESWLGTVGTPHSSLQSTRWSTRAHRSWPGRPTPRTGPLSPQRQSPVWHVSQLVDLPDSWSRSDNDRCRKSNGPPRRSMSYEQLFAIGATISGTLASRNSRRMTSARPGDKSCFQATSMASTDSACAVSIM